MSSLLLIDLNNAPEPAARLLATGQGNLGVIPKVTKAVAHSPAPLKGYLVLSGARGAGVPSATTQDVLTDHFKATDADIDFPVVRP